MGIGKKKARSAASVGGRRQPASQSTGVKKITKKIERKITFVELAEIRPRYTEKEETRFNGCVKHIFAISQEELDALEDLRQREAEEDDE